ncbi:MAG: acyl-CoA dehydrogenase family protein [Pseudomonadota bacterium]
MSAPRPQPLFTTHEVTNQPPPLLDYNLFTSDAALGAALAAARKAPDWAALQAYGAVLGAAETLQAAEDANRHVPELKTHDRYGHRIDEVSFHPAYHHMMGLGVAHRQPSMAWIDAPGAGHVAHCALEFLMHQVEPGVCCPLSMTYAGVPALKHEPMVAEEWLPRLLSDRYDPAFRPAAEKAGATMGMAMTEKQGGSDVRANTTQAKALDARRDEFTLIGHKWFCSAPMCDAFLTLAYSDKGLTCFLVPRWTPEGKRNRIFIQRLKDKLGNRANASSEIEYHGTWARRVGEEGRGVATIIDMVHHTRLDCAVGSASLMRAALVQAVHHCRHRRVFQKTLIDQPLMQNVLADLALEVEAATLLAFHVADAFDASDDDPAVRGYARLAVAIAKYWLGKRAPNFVYEAMECLGGGGYVEEAPMARLYREAPLNSIWEGSGNVICLDILRTLEKEPHALAALMSGLDAMRGGDAVFDATLDDVTASIKAPQAMHLGARRLVERLALLLQSALMLRHAPPPVADAFLASRLHGDWGRVYGTLPSGLALRAIIERALAPAG